MKFQQKFHLFFGVKRIYINYITFVLQSFVFLNESLSKYVTNYYYESHIRS